MAAGSSQLQEAFVTRAVYFSSRTPLLYFLMSSPHLSEQQLGMIIPYLL